MKVKMKIKPEQWTHHHIHRLFHISLGLCFGMAALVMVAGMGAFWMNASAVDVIDSDIVQLTATVAGINPGPVDNPSTTGSYRPPIVTVNPTITIVAEPKDSIKQRNITVGGTTAPAYVFENNRPSFSGTSSVPNGIIFLLIEGPQSLNTTTRAGLDGKWLWQAPNTFVPGVYAITASVFDSYDLTKSGNAKAYFIVPSKITPTTPGQPGTETPEYPGTGTPPVIPPGESTNVIFGIFFEVSPEYKSVETGGKIVTWVTLVSNTGQQITDQDITYEIISPEGKVVVETKDTVSFSKQLQFAKTFNIAPLTPSGTYTVRVWSKYKGVESVASDKFTLREPVAAASVVPQGPAVIWSLLILLFLLFLVLVIIAYRYVRHHTRQLDEANKPTSTI